MRSIKKKTVLPVIILISLMLASCCKATFNDTTYLTNETHYKIEILNYKNGNMTLMISMNALSTIESPYTRPEQNPSDPIVVFFDDELEETHYSKRIPQPFNTNNSIQFTDKRNLFNPVSYAVNQKALSCNGKEVVFTYVFAK